MADDFDDLLDEDIDLDRLLLIEQCHALGIEPPEDEEPDEGPTPEQLEAERLRVQEERLQPIPYKMKPTKKIIAVVDTETNPFEHGLHVKPFALGFYDGNTYVDFWGDDCVKEFFEYLDTRTKDGEQFVIYAHNGGKFDFFFFLPFLDKAQSPFIMNGRLVRIHFSGQEFRDSFSIIPQALAGYKKDEIDYANFARGKREKHKREILDYQRGDCVYLYDLISGFHDMFGDKLTIASASLPMLNSFTGFERFKSERLDERFRAYYYGGRNQCFETGILKPRNGRWLVVDRNSMYPAVMRDELHPISATPILQRDIDDETDFACIVAENDGALPTRDKDGGLDFTVKRGTFFATIHEIRAGLDTGTLRINRVKHAWKFERKTSFADFVNRFYGLRLDSKAAGDKVRDILYKFALNSGYGKFALNPRKFKQYIMTVDEIPTPQYAPIERPEICPVTGDVLRSADGWQHESTTGDIRVWSRPNPRRNGFYNIATAASITGAARANLLRNLALATRPIYCDTDSIICEEFRGETDETRLGGWKVEATGSMAAIAGKKLYAVFDGDNPIKKASKGVRLEASDIVAICEGQEITYANPVPNFKLDGSVEFVTRRISATG